MPPDVIARLGAGRRPPVDVEVNGYRYRSTVGVMNGQHLVSVSAAVRKETGLTGGDPITVTLTLNATPRDVEVPYDLADALRREPTAFEFFGALPNSLQRYHVDQITGAKTPATRQRRVDKAVALFLAGKKR